MDNLEAAMIWVFGYPFLPLQIVLVMLMAWGRLGYEAGVDDLFWPRRRWEQVVNGLACGLLFGVVLLVRHLLDRRDWAGYAHEVINAGKPDPRDLWYSWVPITLFPFGDSRLETLGRYLALFWFPTLTAMWGFKQLSRDVRGGQVRTSFLLVGLLLSVGVFCGTVAAGYGLDLFQIRQTQLFGLILLAGALCGLGVLVLYALHFWGAALPPVVVLCLLLGLLNCVYGYVAYYSPGAQYVLLLAVVGLGVLGHYSSANRDRPYKLSFPGLEEAYAGSRLRIDEEAVPDGDAGWKRNDHYYALLRSQAQMRVGARSKGSAPSPGIVPDLVPSTEPLLRMKESWQQSHGRTTADGSEAKPRIVIFCTSGGGIRAAVWTAVVLEGLEREIPGDPATGRAALRDHIRLFTGASGGMVGAGLYAAGFEAGPLRPERDGTTELGPLSSLLARDSLRRTIQTMALVDLPSLWWPGQVTWDRGREIERVWAANTESLSSFKQSPFRRTFRDLQTLERSGRRPSLVFSPMLVEDARRLLVSNLDLLDLTWTSGFNRPVAR